MANHRIPIFPIFLDNSPVEFPRCCTAVHSGAGEEAFCRSVLILMNSSAQKPHLLCWGFFIGKQHCWIEAAGFYSFFKKECWGEKLLSHGFQRLLVGGSMCNVTRGLCVRQLWEEQNSSIKRVLVLPSCVNIPTRGSGHMDRIWSTSHCPTATHTRTAIVNTVYTAVGI